MVGYATDSGYFCALVRVALLEYVVEEIGQRQIFQFSPVPSAAARDKAFLGSELDAPSLFSHLARLANPRRQKATTPPDGAGGILSVMRPTFLLGYQSVG